MGNKEGLLESAIAMGKNEVIDINEIWYFSFAYGDEIALVNGKSKETNPYWILNCSQTL